MRKPSKRDSKLADSPKREVILLAVTGKSPAIITETVWALAFPGKDSQPVVPDRVIAITTSDGRQCIQNELFTAGDKPGSPTVWDQLQRAIVRKIPSAQGKLRFGTTGDDVRVFTLPDTRGRSQELDDIADAASNLRAADFILEQVRGVTQNPDCRLIASMAGGRKTMGALLYAAMSLLGRGDDRLTHVLVSEPFESPGLNPRFYFPKRGVTHQLKTHECKVIGEHPSASARLQLADVPFVRLHKLFPAHFGKLPGRFSALVELYSDRVEEIGRRPEVRLLEDQLALEVNRRRIEIDYREWCTYSYFLHRLRKALPTSVYQQDEEAGLKSFLAATADARAKLLRPLTERERKKIASGELETHDRVPLSKDWKGATIEDLRRKVSSLRKKFSAAGLQSLLPYLLPTRRRFGIDVIDLSNSKE